MKKMKWLKALLIVTVLFAAADRSGQGYRSHRNHGLAAKKSEKC